MSFKGHETRESRKVPSPVRQLSRRLTREVDGKDDSDAFGAFHGEPDEEELLLERLKAPKGGGNGDFLGTWRVQGRVVVVVVSCVLVLKMKD